ncbi:8725_t:CDS:2 [Cetraspora pellucida]|uniref:8725_t:CDS:1 n=1 Tax=Cetraspora pellucida TaxID=1433469 RepID=A0A9N9NL41_9GLOM|nr:8725_t:CDS:2 [Cetraspora pellucida]
MTASDYIQTDDNIEIKEVVLNEVAILEEILSQFDSNSSSDESDIEIEKFSYSVILKQYLPQLLSLLKQI